MAVDDRTNGDPLESALPAEIEQHVEWLAERVHDAWSDERRAGGWRHGPNRDEHRKEHPSLVQYPDLPQTERHLDRVVVMATLTGMMELGYRFERKPK